MSVCHSSMLLFILIFQQRDVIQYIKFQARNLQNMKKDAFIGLAVGCECSCINREKEVFDKEPHQGKHQIIAEKQLIKRLTTSKISTVGCLVEENCDLIRQEFTIMLEKLKKYEEEAIQSIKSESFKSIVYENIQPSNGLIKTFIKLSNIEYEDLSCSQINQAFTSVDKNSKEGALQLKTQKIFSNLKNQVLSAVHESFQIFPHCDSNASSSTNQQQPAKKPVLEVSDVKLIATGPKGEQSAVTDTKLDETDFTIDFSQSASTVREDQKKKKPCDTLIDLLDFEDDLDDGQQDFFQKKQEKQQKKKVQEKQQKKTQKVFKKKPVIENFDQQPKAENKSQQKKTQTTQISGSAASYIRKEEARYYIRVGHLQKPQYREQKATFNIKLKVLKIIVFRQAMNKYSKKVHNKVKFVGGDETGIIVCYTDYAAGMKVGSYVVLLDCSLYKFHGLSLQINSHNTKIEQSRDNFGVSAVKSLSRFESFNPITYSIQKFEQKWPSIDGIKSQKHGKYKDIFVIAEITGIIEENQNTLNCQISDGTGTIYAVIHTKDCPTFQIGQVYSFKKVTPSCQKIGNQQILFLELGSQNKPALMQGMTYDIK